MIKKWPRVGKVGKVGLRSAVKASRGVKLAALTGGGVKQLNVMPEQLALIAQRIGDRRARDVWKLKMKGVQGSLPELCAYEWLEKRKLVFEFQTSLMGGRRVSGGAVMDFLIYGLSANGIMCWRIQGEYWHTGPDVERKDFVQKARLRGLKIGGVPVVEVVDVWESDVYDRYPEVFVRAEAGIGLRG